MVRIEDSPSIFFRGMAGSVLPIAVAHREGRVEPLAAGDVEALESSGLVAARFVDGAMQPTERPYNPNGSVRGVTALTGRGCGCSTTRALGWGEFAPRLRNVDPK